MVCALLHYETVKVRQAYHVISEKVAGRSDRFDPPTKERIMKCTSPLKQQKIPNLTRSNPMQRPKSKELCVGLILLVASVVLTGSLLYGQGSDDALFIDRDGTVRIQDLDVKNRVNTQDVKATGTVEANKFEGDGSSLKLEGNRALNEALDRKLDKAGGKLEGSLDVNGLVRARTFESTNPFRHRMYPDNPIVYQDIFDAKEKGVIVRLGNSPKYSDVAWGRNHLWNDRPVIIYGGQIDKESDGAKVTIPEGYNTVWVRVAGDRWNVIQAYSLDPEGKNFGFWAGGKRFGNNYCPDGSLSDSYSNAHQWLPIPAGGVRILALISSPPKNVAQGNGEMWMSGLAFSRNPWAHAAQSALGYHWGVNGTPFDDVKWENDSYGGDVLARIDKTTKGVLKVPVVPSGRDKLLYLIAHNSDWNDCAHTGITVNGQKIERFMATYDNPFARHWNSKVYARYIAARIPSSLVPQDARYLDVQIDMSKQNSSIKFREIGTHDLEMPQDY